MTWEQITQLEPRLAAMKAEAQKVKDPGGPAFCANSIWYNQFKCRLITLVGWGAAETELQSSQAYDLAYKTIYNQLPACRNCTCI